MINSHPYHKYKYFNELNQVQHFNSHSTKKHLTSLGFLIIKKTYPLYKLPMISLFKSANDVDKTEFELQPILFFNILFNL